MKRLVLLIITTLVLTSCAKMQKIIILSIMMLLTITLTSCKEKIEEPVVTPPEIDCTTNPNHESCQTTSINCKEDRDNELCLDPEYWSWPLNEEGFDGKGEEINIYTLDYYGHLTKEQQNQISIVNKAYNVSIKLQDYPEGIDYGKDQIDYIANNANGIYIIDSSLVNSLVKRDAIIALDQLFEEVGYVQDDYYNQITTVNSKIYGYNHNSHYRESYLFYNKDLVEKYNLDDPAVLWNRREWTWSKFLEYIDFAADKMTSSGMSEYVIFEQDSMSFTSSILLARGIKQVNNGEYSLENEELIAAYEELQQIAMSQKPYWFDNGSHVGVSYSDGRYLFTDGRLWFIDNEERWSSNLNFEIGVVPYPRADDDPNLEKYYLLSETSDVVVIGKDTNIPTNTLFNIIDDLSNGLKPQEKSGKNTFVEYVIEKVKFEENIKAIIDTQDISEIINYYDYTDKYLCEGKKAGHEYSIWGCIYNIYHSSEKVNVKEKFLKLKKTHQQVLDELS